tara:strand:- start:343 stop:516 length:174 start_codon:yes stop_codon:yes gene_type:complete
MEVFQVFQQYPPQVVAVVVDQEVQPVVLEQVGDLVVVVVVVQQLLESLELEILLQLP